MDMQNILAFLKELAEHNDRPWFEANKAWYREADAQFKEFAVRLIGRMEDVDPEVAGLAVKDCTWRIYRDVRFSKDKAPYKRHFGVYLSPGGKKSGLSGYYFHVEPEDGEEFGRPLLAAGVYRPEPKVLQSLREEAFSNGAALEDALRPARAAGFTMEGNERLTRVPRGYPAGSPFEDWLKLKDFSVYKPLSEADLLAPDLLDRLVEDFRTTVGFNKLLDRAVRYAWEEEAERSGGWAAGLR